MNPATGSAPVERRCDGSRAPSVPSVGRRHRVGDRCLRRRRGRAPRAAGCWPAPPDAGHVRHADSVDGDLGRPVRLPRLRRIGEYRDDLPEIPPFRRIVGPSGMNKP
jgi:hypothetical protein